MSAVERSGVFEKGRYKVSGSVGKGGDPVGSRLRLVGDGHASSRHIHNLRLLGRHVDAFLGHGPGQRHTP